jgi:hypothetical protein
LYAGNVREAIARLEAAAALLPAGRRGSLDADIVRFELGVAYLRLAETENCCARHDAESCILPLGPGGRHRDREGSQRAIEHFAGMLAASSGAAEFLEVEARWLLNLAAMTLGTYPASVPPDLRVPEGRFAPERPVPRFRNVAPALGLDALNLAGSVVADDFDGDGFLDLLVSTYDPRGQLRLYRNGGDGTFADRTREAGLAGEFGGLNMVQADYDNDGDTDVLVLRGAWLGAPAS